MKTKTYHQYKEVSSIVLPPKEEWENHNSYFRLFSGRITIQTFDDRKDKKNVPQIFHIDGDMPDTLSATLSHRNKNGMGIYMTVNETDGKGRKAVNVIKVRSAFADLDGSPREPADKLNPTLIVESSPGRFHCYWFTEDTPLEAFTQLQINIARILKADPVAKDLPRVLRVPGFYHMKEDPFMSRICGGSGLIFTYLALVEMFPPEKVAQFSAKRYKLEKKDIPLKEFKGQYGAGNGERNDHLMRRIGGMIKAKRSWSYIEAEAFKEGMACVPPLEEREILAVLKSARRYV